MNDDKPEDACSRVVALNPKFGCTRVHLYTRASTFTHQVFHLPPRTIEYWSKISESTLLNVSVYICRTDDDVLNLVVQFALIGVFPRDDRDLRQDAVESVYTRALPTQGQLHTHQFKTPNVYCIYIRVSINKCTCAPFSRKISHRADVRRLCDTLFVYVRIYACAGWYNLT